MRTCAFMHPPGDMGYMPGEGEWGCHVHKLLNSPSDSFRSFAPLAGRRRVFDIYASPDITRRRDMFTILIAEDHPIVREPLSQLLELEGYQTVRAVNGNEAWAAVQDRTIDLVLLDLMMPRRGGIDFLEAVRNDRRHRDLPVLILTGVIEGSVLNRARELGVQNVLAKSRFTMEELLANVRHCLANRETRCRPLVPRNSEPEAVSSKQ